MNQNQPNMQGQQAAPAYPQQPPQQPAPKSRPAMGIVSLVLGIIALLTSFLPIVNNLSALLAFVGLVFGIIGIVITSKNKCGGKGLSIAGTIICIVSLIIVLATQALFSAAIDQATSSSSPTQTTSSANTESEGESGEAATESFEDLPIGTAVELGNGLSVTVDSVQAGLKNYDGSEITGITVTYVNNGDSSESFNVLDWKGQDAQGAQRSTTYYSDADNQLNSGSLAAGGSVTGNIYFDGAITKAVYEQIISFSDEPISWVLS